MTILFSSLGKILILVGGALIVLGGVLAFFDRLPLVGKLPGDIVIRKKDFTIYFPIATSILLSILITVLVNLFGRK